LGSTGGALKVSTRALSRSTKKARQLGGLRDLELQLAQLRYVVSSPAAATTLAENYVGIAGRMA